MSKIDLPQQFKIVDATAGPVTTNGGVTCDYVSLKNAVKAWLVLQFTQAVGHATVVQPQTATAVAGTAAASITHAARGWINADTATSDALVAQTAATSFTLAATIKKHMVVVEIDPVQWGAVGTDVAGCTISDSSQVTNFVSGVWILQTKHGGATPPTAITD
jgi:hypothetical protein